MYLKTHLVTLIERYHYKSLQELCFQAVIVLANLCGPDSDVDSNLRDLQWSCVSGLGNTEAAGLQMPWSAPHPGLCWLNEVLLSYKPCVLVAMATVPLPWHTQVVGTETLWHFTENIYNLAPKIFL